MFPATPHPVHGTSWRLTDMACCSDRARHRRADTPAAVTMATPAAPATVTSVRLKILRWTLTWALGLARVQRPSAWVDAVRA